MAEVTLNSDDFEIDDKGNVRLKDPEKRAKLLECIDDAQRGTAHKDQALPQVKVKM